MNIQSEYAGGRLTASFSGELDQHEARSAMNSLDELLDAYLPRDLVLDLSGLKFMDSSGIALIVRVSRRMQILGGRAWIEDPARQPQRVIDAAGIDRLVPIAMSR